MLIDSGRMSSAKNGEVQTDDTVLIVEMDSALTQGEAVFNSSPMADGAS